MIAGVLLAALVAFSLSRGAAGEVIALVAGAGIVAGALALYGPWRLALSYGWVLVLPMVVIVIGTGLGVRLAGVGGYPWIGGVFVGLALTAQRIGSSRRPES